MVPGEVDGVAEVEEEEVSYLMLSILDEKLTDTI